MTIGILFLCSLLIISIQCQSLFEIYKAMIADQNARAHIPPVNIEVFGESLCPDTTRFFNYQLMPLWNALQASSVVNVTYHPFGLASCKERNGQISCKCQHGPRECQLNQLQACVISALEVPQLYLPIISCMQGEMVFSKAVDNCIVNYRPRPDLDENFMIRCAQSQLGMKLMMQHGMRQTSIAKELDWVPWILINGRRSEAAENMLKTIVCNFSEPSRFDYCKTPEEAII